MRRSWSELWKPSTACPDPAQDLRARARAALHCKLYVRMYLYRLCNPRVWIWTSPFSFDSLSTRSQGFSLAA